MTQSDARAERQADQVVRSEAGRNLRKKGKSASGNHCTTEGRDNCEQLSYTAAGRDGVGRGLETGPSRVRQTTTT